MKSVAVRQVCKEWNRVLTENAGIEVPITNRGRIIAYLRVLPRKKGQKVDMPDFKKRMQARFGERTLKARDARWLDEAMRSAF